ncbi:dihydroxyacetone kinase phosphoryl donor subunit DhaM [Escherichia coli]
MSLSRTQIVNWLTRCGDIFSTESEYLTGLDREIGDADHGLNMNRGFSKVVEKLPAIADKDIGFILKNTGMTLLSSVGGASGPLFGTFFIRAAQATQARQSLTLEELYQMFRDGVDGVISRGKAEPIGTDAVKVMEAIESVADADHVLVMMDMGSALLSAETALELLAPKIAAKVRLCAAPLVEGTLAATVSAASGADIDKVIFDAMHALEAKREQLGLPSSDTKISDTCPAYDEEARSLAVVIKNRNGLHVRPASRLVYTLSTFNADMLLEKNGKCVTPESINQIALLQVRYNDTLRLIAKGPEAEEALIAFRQLAEDNFGETEEVAPPTLRPVPPVSGKAFYYQPVLCTVQAKSTLTVEEEQDRLRQAIDFTLLDLMTLTAKAEASGLDDIAAIFSGHHTLLDDPELLAAASELLQHEHCTAEYAWQQVLKELSQQYQQLDDEYLQARYIDVDDLLHRTLVHLTQTKEELPQFNSPTILLAENIYPSTVLQLDPAVVKGICLSAGSPVSHSALIARELGIGWICQQGEKLYAIQPEETLTLDVKRQRFNRQG